MDFIARSRWQHDVDSLTVWRVQLRGIKHAVLPSQTSRPNPLAVGGCLFVSVLSPGAVLCLDRGSGAVLWRRRLTPLADASVVHAGGSLFAKTPHTLYCLDPETGWLRWNFSPHGSQGETMYSAPSVNDGRVFIGDRQGYLHALDALSGHPLWHVLTSRASNNDVNGPPLVDRDRVLVATNAGRFIALEKATGTMIWNEPIGHPCISEITVCPGAFALLTSLCVSWHDRQTGKLLEKHRFPRWFNRAVASKGRNVAVAIATWSGNSQLLMFQDARLLFKQKHAAIFNLRWLPSGRLVETRFDGIGTLDPSNGMRVHDIAFHERCQLGQPEEFDQHLYVLTEGGAVYALRWPPRVKK